MVLAGRSRSGNLSVAGRHAPRSKQGTRESTECHFRLGINANSCLASQKGCTSCLIRKVKCDEQRPVCKRCTAARVQCSWDKSERKQEQLQRRQRGVTSRRRDNKTPIPLNEIAQPILRLPTSSSSPLSSSTTSPQASSSTEDVDEEYGPVIFSPASNNFFDFLSRVSDGAAESMHLWGCSPSVPHFAPVSIPQTPSEAQIPLTNSLIMSAQDRTYWDYFPTSATVYAMGKSFTWSNHRYLYQNLAADDSMVMRSALALSSSERFRMQNSDNSLALRNTGDPGLHHYGLALQELFIVLGNIKSSNYSVESVLSCLYLLISYESKHGTSVSNLQLHLDGLCSYLDTQLNATRSNSLPHVPGKSGFTSYCAQVLLWIM